MEIPIKNYEDKQDLDRSIELLERIPTKQKALQMISEAKYILASKNEDVMIKCTLLEESLKFDQTNRVTRRELAQL